MDMNLFRKHLKTHLKESPGLSSTERRAGLRTISRALASKDEIKLTRYAQDTKKSIVPLVKAFRTFMDEWERLVRVGAGNSIIDSLGESHYPLKSDNVEAAEKQFYAWLESFSEELDDLIEELK